jgi:DNA-binding transcriptional MerR regulator
MTWSTSRLAQLADTTVPTVRHYHRMGLLAEPERLSNGYKQYTAAHLVRLLQIRRLADRGVPLTRIGAILREDADSAAALEEVDAELEASMQRLARARAELALLREHRARADTPAGFEALSRGLSERQRSLLTLFSTVMGPDALEEFRQSLVVGNDVDEEFEALPATADEETIEVLAGWRSRSTTRTGNARGCGTRSRTRPSARTRRAWSSASPSRSCTTPRSCGRCSGSRRSGRTGPTGPPTPREHGGDPRLSGALRAHSHSRARA